MTKRRILGFLVVILCLSAFLVGCGSSKGTSDKSSGGGSSSTGGNKSSNTILVGADTTFPPFESEKNGTVTGFDIEMIKAIAKKEGLKVEQIKTMPFDGIIPALQGDQVDVAVAGITIKTSRMETVDFSNAYYKSGLSILVKKDSGINSLDDLKGKLVATKKATSSVDFLKSHGFKDANIKQYDDINTAYQTLESGGADAVVFDNPVNINFMNSHDDVHIVGGLLTGEYYGIAVTKDKPELLKKINDGLKAIQDDGTYAKLFDKYLGGDKNGLVNDVKAPKDVALDDE
ncbi:basic amino acid ABC transporter substrate-binding protein [Pullulanibacillus sp. KACC 23026]|uniref:basic amino acid ABC transporter substrate-binding protein n=1 Tax=Pullulanibacillus sp. KACC 23026 TaxID=3028315 RepID=UPI0023B1F09A|nr:basic amino acid ABC transporter substrate-binding protein [Pullulanibacillus sp. KACC 23026]WEG14213.1 basic amino acid ABC transporter substrate-binding protein [Pullulanibacillus sp. KACC 23026]